MSDATNTPAPAASAVVDGTGAPTFTPAQVSSMRDAWLQHGGDPARFDVAAGLAKPVAPSRSGDALNATSATVSATPPRDGAPGHVQVLGGDKSPPLTAQQAREMAEALTKAGVDPARVREAAAPHGVIPDDRSDAERENDANWGMDKLVEPHEYKLSYVDVPQARGMEPAKLAAFDQGAREWLSGMQAMPGEGQFVIERALEVAHEHAGWSDAERQSWALSQRYQLEQRLGPDGFKETMRLAAYALRVGGASNTFYADMQKACVFDDPFIVRTLANVGRRIEGWTKGQRK